MTKQKISWKTQKRKSFLLKMTQILVSVVSAFEIIYIIRPQPFENFSCFNSKRSIRVAILTLFYGCECMCFIPAETSDEYSASTFSNHFESFELHILKSDFSFSSSLSLINSSFKRSAWLWCSVLFASVY